MNMSPVPRRARPSPPCTGCGRRRTGGRAAPRSSTCRAWRGPRPARRRGRRTGSSGRGPSGSAGSACSSGSAGSTARRATPSQKNWVRHRAAAAGRGGRLVGLVVMLLPSRSAVPSASMASIVAAIDTDLSEHLDGVFAEPWWCTVEADVEIAEGPERARLLDVAVVDVPVASDHPGRVVVGRGEERLLLVEPHLLARNAGRGERVERLGAARGPERGGGVLDLVDARDRAQRRELLVGGGGDRDPSVGQRQDPVARRDAGLLVVEHRHRAPSCRRSRGTSRCWSARRPPGASRRRTASGRCGRGGTARAGWRSTSPSRTGGP